MFPADAVRAWHVVTLPPERDPDAWIAKVRDYAGGIARDWSDGCLGDPRQA